MRWVFGLLTSAVLFVVAWGAAAEQGQIVGTATYRERMALPPGAVFEAVLEDVTAADSPARELGRTTIADPGMPPFEFEIDFDPADVSPDRTYSVRAQVSVGRRLMFVSDAMNPVLTAGAADRVDIGMIKVGDTAEEATVAPESIGAHGLRLPATFSGVLPCEDCPGVEYHLNLWPDQVFQLRRTWEGRKVARDAIGRWAVDPDQHVLTLRGAGPEIRFRILGPSRLGLIQPGSDPTEKRFTLSAAPEFEALELHLPLRGMVTYVADEARFTECLTGRDFPLAQDGDYEALEHAYLAAGAEAGGPIMASFDGAIVRQGFLGGGDQPQVIVERFVGVWPGETCERPLGKVSLTNTYWKILRLGLTEISATEGGREPNLILREGDPQFTATVGCNQIVGRYMLDEDRLAFEPRGSTRMACRPPLDAWEAHLNGILAEARGWRIDGQTMELLDAAAAPLALFQAVYLY